ncbi:MAG: hypothetical protein H7Z17_00405 [Fuerstia sp.]|nr:hypothetical protein [Fuerstiella sp.]
MSSGALPRVAGLQEILDRCQRLIRVYTVLRGFAESLCVLIACILFGCLLDYFVALPGVVRLAGLVGTLFLTGAVAWKRLIHPLVSSASAEELGAAVDLRFPQLQEAIATLISVDSPTATSSEVGSALMRNRLEQHIRVQIGSIRPSAVVLGSPTVKRWGLAMMSVLALVIPLLLWPSGSMLLLQRFAMPFANLAAPSNLFFEVPDGNRTVAANTDVLFVAIPRWRTNVAGALPTDVVLEMQAAGATSEDLPMAFDDTESNFTVSLADVRESLRYRVRGGGATTEWFELTVAVPPRILTAVLQETPPTYTGRPIETFDGVVGDIHVFEHSALEITLTFNKPVKNVVMDWQTWKPLPAPDGVAATASDIEPPTAAAVLSADGTSARFQFEALGSGQFEFRVEDSLGLTNLNETMRRLIVTTDTPPKLTVSGIQDALEVRPGDVLPLNCVVVDDIGVGELELHVRRNSDATRIEPAVGFNRGALQVGHDFQIDLKSLDVHEGDTVTVKVKSADERPIPGPQVVWQGPWTIRIADNAEAIGQKSLREADQKLVESLRKLEAQLQQDANKGNELKDKLRREWNDAVQQGVRELSEKEQTQGRELQQLAEQAAAHPLMEKQAEKLTELAQQIRKDVPEKLDAAAGADRDPAAQNIQESVNELNRIREELHRATDEIEKAAKLEQELAELNRLALEAQQLSNDSQKLQEERKNQQPEEGQSKEDLQKQQDEKQQQLQQEQRRLTADLGDLLQRKQELLQAAREAQLDRAAEIAEEAQRLAQQQQQLAEGVNEEARDAARDAQELANELQQTRNEADQLGNQIQQQAPDVQSPEVQPLDDAIRDLRQGNLATPQDGIEKSQEQLAKATEDLAKPIAAPVADPNAPAVDQNTQREQDRKRAEQNDKRQELGKKASDINERLEQIEDKIAAMATELGAKPQESANAASEQQPDGQQPADDAAQNPALKPMDGLTAQKSEDLPPGDQSQEEVGENLLDELAKMVEAAHETADAVDADRRAENGAKQKSKQAAEKADDALRNALAGQFSRAAERMQNSADDSGAAADQLKNEEQQDRRTQLEQQRDDFNRMSDVFKQLQDNDHAQVAAQQETQNDVAEAAEQLPTPLEDLAERLNIPELGLQNQARPAQEAAQAAREGAQSGEAASGQLDETQLQQAGQKAQEAAGHLNRAAQLAQQAAQGHRDPNALIPTEVGESVSDALQSLQKASEMIDQEAAQRAAAEQAAQQAAEQAASQQSPDGQAGQQSEAGQPGEAGKPGQPGAEGQPGEAGQQQGKPGEGQPGEGEQGQGQPGQSGEGQQPGQPGDAKSGGGKGQPGSAAQQMARAAKSLKDAARGALPNQFSPGQLSSEPSSAAGEPKGDGNVAEFDGKDPSAARRKGTPRMWGRVQDDLDADVSDAGKEVMDNEYSELIRRYRRDLARNGQQSDSKPNAGKP